LPQGFEDACDDEGEKKKRKVKNPGMRPFTKGTLAEKEGQRSAEKVGGESLKKIER